MKKRRKKHPSTTPLPQLESSAQRSLGSNYTTTNNNSNSNTKHPQVSPASLSLKATSSPAPPAAVISTNGLWPFMGGFASKSFKPSDLSLTRGKIE
jgi:hypothetical protein